MAKIKLYTDKSVAESLASTLTASKGVKHNVYAVPGGFNVMTEEQHTAANTATTPAPKAAAKKPAAPVVPAQTKAKDTSGEEVVTFECEGRVKAVYVITGKIAGKERWFERKRLSAEPVVLDGGKVRLTLTRKMLASRGLKTEAAAAQKVA
jgi:hypothetical protein